MSPFVADSHMETKIFMNTDFYLVFGIFLFPDERGPLSSLLALLLPVTLVFQPKSYTKHTYKTYTKTNTTI